MVYILGINEAHNSTACLLKDGKVIACASEERFNRIKNYIGFPIMSVNYLMKYAGINTIDLDLVVLSFESASPIIENPIHGVHKTYSTMYTLWNFLNEARYRKLGIIAKPAYKFGYAFYNKLFYKKYKRKQVNNISKLLGVKPEKIISVDHHICHSYAAVYSTRSMSNSECLALTHDGAGDNTCGMVSVVSNDDFKIVSTTPNENSLANLYGAVTTYLGMKINEHEYKVMGLAPYAYSSDAEKVYKILKDLVWVENMRFYTKFSSFFFYKYLIENLHSYRFDWVAGAMQRLTEELLLKYVTDSVEKTGINKVSLGGGVFMNVKANMRIQYDDAVDETCVCPSSGDESTAIGAAFYGYKTWCKNESKNFITEPLSNLYLGPSFTEEEILSSLKKYRLEENYKIERIDNIEEEIADIIAKGNIVARFKGRMEWGARALGNRSILANPSDLSIIEPLNKQIKSRDFWMPFAPSILAERENDYIINPKNTKAPFMVIAFDSTELGKKELKAAMHPYDKTLRPQIVSKEANETYWNLIKNFENITGIGSVLNTSFNLHGEPIVCNVDDAIHTLTNSGLRFLAVENFLISKKN